MLLQENSNDGHNPCYVLSHSKATGPVHPVRAHNPMHNAYTGQTFFSSHIFVADLKLLLKRRLCARGLKFRINKISFDALRYSMSPAYSVGNYRICEKPYPSVCRPLQFPKFPCISVVLEPYAENCGECLIITFIGLTQPQFYK
jgi:hypothetical protein